MVVLPFNTVYVDAECPLKQGYPKDGALG